MVDKPQPTDAAPAPAPGIAPPAPGAPRRGPGQRGADMRDTVAEMAERAQLISQEAGSKVAAAMKDVISAAAGIAGFAIESARDLVQYMVKRGQMTPEEAEKLIREAEAAHDKRPASEKSRPTATKVAAERAAIAKAEAAARAAAQAAAAPPSPFRPLHRPPTPAAGVAKQTPVAAKPAIKPAAKAPAKVPAKPAKASAKSAKPAKPAAKSSKGTPKGKGAKR
jgi:polyhydroxyalkanoate synthesis regulator phasin